MTFLFSSPAIFQRLRHLHFIGIGGAGMGGIAEVLFHQGFYITGSDCQESAMTSRLQSLGIPIFFHHAAENIQGAQVIVRSAAVDDANPEIQAAHHARLPVVPRAVMLGELMRFRYGIAIAGTHGKTTTTSLATALFAQAGLDPTFVIGGLLNSAGAHARLGKGDYFIAEADESDASFLHLHPMIAVITNIDADHMETYHHNFDQLKKTFLDFIHHLPFYGLAILCFEDPPLRSLIPSISRRICTYGFSDKADIYAENITQIGTKNYFRVHRPFLPPLEITLNLAGEHNVLNALSIIALGTEAGISDEIMAQAFENFSGVGRRMQVYGDYKLSCGSVLLIDDYGHHPREITVTCEAVRKAFPARRVVMVYQPHRYSRTRELLNDFAQALSLPDELLLLDIYSAGEQPLAGVDSKVLLDLLNHQRGEKPLARLVSPKETLEETLKKMLKDQDVLLMQGAGDIGVLAAQLAEKKLIF